MKRSRLNPTSDRGRLQREADCLFSQLILKERGPNCEIHGKICDRVGNMHILSKAAHPKLRYVGLNVIRAGWFCSHYWTHHDGDDPRAILTKQRILEILGPDYKQKLVDLEQWIGKHDTLYLRAKIQEFKDRLHQSERLRGKNI